MQHRYEFWWIDAILYLEIQRAAMRRFILRGAVLGGGTIMATVAVYALVCAFRRNASCQRMVDVPTHDSGEPLALDEVGEVAEGGGSSQDVPSAGVEGISSSSRSLSTSSLPQNLQSRSSREPSRSLDPIAPTLVLALRSGESESASLALLFTHSQPETPEIAGIGLGRGIRNGSVVSALMRGSSREMPEDFSARHRTRSLGSIGRMQHDIPLRAYSPSRPQTREARGERGVPSLEFHTQGDRGREIISYDHRMRVLRRVVDLVAKKQPIIRSHNSYAKATFFGASIALSLGLFYAFGDGAIGINIFKEISYRNPIYKLFSLIHMKHVIHLYPLLCTFGIPFICKGILGTLVENYNSFFGATPKRSVLETVGRVVLGCISILAYYNGTIFSN